MKGKDFIIIHPDLTNCGGHNIIAKIMFYFVKFFVISLEVWFNISSTLVIPTVPSLSGELEKIISKRLLRVLKCPPQSFSMNLTGGCI